MYQTIEKKRDDLAVAEVNDHFFGLLDSNPKLAGDAAQDFIRLKMREDSFLPNILPEIPTTNAELDIQAESDKPMRVEFLEPGSPGAVTLPFGQNTYNEIIQGQRIRLEFDRIATPKFVADVDTLRTYRGIDIRQVLSDNSIKDIGFEQDGKFLGATNALLSNGLYIPGQTVAATGVVQWRQITGGITRETISDAKTTIMRTPAKFAPEVALCNMITFTKFEAFGRDEAGGDLAQEIFVDGMTQRKIGGVNYVVTIKTELVPEDVIYWASSPKNLGKFRILEDVTLFLKKEAWWIEFFSWKLCGGVIGNIAGICRTDFVA